MANADNAESNGNGSASVGVGADNSNSINNATSPVSTGAYTTNLNTDSGSGDVVSLKLVIPRILNQLRPLEQSC